MLLYIFISIIVALVILIIYGTYSRKKIYEEINRIESRKIKLMNRPLTEEMAKVKSLEMIGETEKNFDTWRGEWDEMVTVELPDIEERLFDVEEAVDKYKFKKARKALVKTNAELKDIEMRIETIRDEINDLVKSEELNRSEIGELKDKYNNIRKFLLAQGQTLGFLATPFEKRLETVSEDFLKFDAVTEEGNHVQARKELLVIHEKLQNIQKEMEFVPNLLMQVQSEIPSNMKELQNGITEMKEKGFNVEQLGVQKELDKLATHLKYVNQKLKQFELQEAKNEIDAIHKKMDECYELLENEVFAKKFVLSEAEGLNERIKNLLEQISQLKEDTNVVKLSYQIEQENIEAQKDLEKTIQKIRHRYSVVEQALLENDQSYISLQEKMHQIINELDSSEKLSSEYKEKLHSLRKDEMEAMEEIARIKRKLKDAYKLVEQNNLPGLPENFLFIFEEAEQSIYQVQEKLEEKPLRISSVIASLDVASKKVEGVCQKTVTIVDRAVWAERLIQYGNRYRSTYQSVALKLNEAESAFRSYQYDEALECAAEAIDGVEPGILKELEKNFEKEKV